MRTGFAIALAFSALAFAADNQAKVVKRIDMSVKGATLLAKK